MAALRPRFSPGDNVPAFCKTAVSAGRFVKIVDDITADKAYQIGHCDFGELAFGVATADSGPTSQDAHSVERMVNVARRGAIAHVVPGAAINAGDEVMSDGDGKAIVLNAAARATLDTGVVADDNAIDWSAVAAGTACNSITIELANAGDANTTLSVNVTGSAIEVELGTTNVGPGSITSTAQDVVDLINADPDASALVFASLEDGSDGTGLMTALAPTNLTGGAAATGDGVALGTACNTVESDAAFVEVDLY